jgi:glycosyltransferase involved in cell wall biosynthesis
MSLGPMLAQAGVDVHYVLQRGARAAGFLREKGVPVTELPFRSRLDLGSLRELRAIMRRFQPDVVHAYTGKTCWLCIHAQWPTKRVPMVFYRGAARKPLRWMVGDRALFFSRWVDAYDCNCEAVADALIAAGVARDKVMVNPYGHLADWYQTESTQTVTAAPAGCPRIGVVANYRPVKGLEILLAAADLLHGRGENFELVWVGSDDRGRFGRQIERANCRDKVRMVGLVVPPWTWMRSFDCLVIPSLQEGLCKTALEAFACGVPIVASDTGGLAEIIEHDVDGFLVPPRQPKLLADAIWRVVTDKAVAERYRQGGQLAIRTKFSLDATRDRLMGLYAALASRFDPASKLSSSQ